MFCKVDKFSETLLAYYFISILRPKKRTKSHFNDTNQRYDVRKSDLEVILMIPTQDTTSEKAI